MPDESVSLADDSITLSDGSVTLADGSVTLSDGSVTLADERHVVRSVERALYFDVLTSATLVHFYNNIIVCE